MATKAVVLHSGGMDSTVCLLMALDKGREVLSLGIDYGQRATIELEYAEQQCLRFGVPRRVVLVRWDKPERAVPQDRTPEEMRGSVSSAFVPGRNAVFLAVGSAEAASLGATEVWIGINCVDYAGYPDCRPEFVQAFRQMIQTAIPAAPGIIAPLLNMSKPEIAREAHRLGLQEDDTWCCYRPIATSEGTKPCGRCDACVLHEIAWRSLVRSEEGRRTG